MITQRLAVVGIKWFIWQPVPSVAGGVVGTNGILTPTVWVFAAIVIQFTRLLSSPRTALCVRVSSPNFRSFTFRRSSRRTAVALKELYSMIDRPVKPRA